MSDDGGEIYRLIEVTNDRLTDLQKNYRVLNDNHHNLELRFTEMRARLETIVQIIKFFISPAVALLVLAELLTLVGVIK